MAEFDLIDLLRRRCGLARADVKLGIGDDAALLVVPEGHDLAVCTDTMVAGVHFPLSTPPADIGWKSLAINLSDLAAMGANPAWASLALTLPTADRDFVLGFADGFAELAGQYQVALIGGDTTRGPLSITITAHGFIPSGQALRRNGARAGDIVFVSGTLGDAAAGLRCAGVDGNGAGARPVASNATSEALIARLNRPQPRLALGQVLRGRASACIDVSDGLVADLGHVAASSGIGIEIHAPTLPASPSLLASLDADACRDLQLAGGDDYELAFTIAEADIDAMLAAVAGTGIPVTRIGRVVRESGVHVLDRNGSPLNLVATGWDHFA